ncbi:undecaprenyl-diphosphatase [Clostridium cavendishii DSM 21758]|uniref:Undecaprenyl-diphosphatase n=1 Tax=Clostridium cavendishii DSM 21758 TaxID=1121302 RepID=A0A1M6R0D4_9CLOT|nr:phosphatase PAP2 family protein [Clostridium cavendishii]SHK25893.1 undecaprenyl-diphosphatase [Clostridium cavendishii DSM 21758]
MIDYFKKIDMKFSKYINENLRSYLLDKIMRIITRLGDLGFVWIIIGTICILKKTYKVEGNMILSALVVSTILGEGIIKHTVKRERPSAVEEEELIISKPKTYSFPSGHTASSFAVVGILIATGSRLKIYALILAILIAFSRIYLNVHYLSDVLSGVLLGLICSSIVFCYIQL